MTESLPPTITVPARGLVILIGVTGSGKSTFARAHFRPTEIVSSDDCRAIVSDDENDQDATPDAFALLETIVSIRLRRGLLTVVDATNVQPKARASLLALARDHDVFADAIVFELDEKIAIVRDAARTDRQAGARVVKRQQNDLTRSLGKLRQERFRRVHRLTDQAQIDTVQVIREQPWNDRRELTGPFDVIGDVHGCLGELHALLDQLGWLITFDDHGRPIDAEHPEGRSAIFVGDLVDRGPDTPGVLRLVMAMVAGGRALCVSGNHEAKLLKAMTNSGRRPPEPRHGLAESLTQLAAETEEFRAEVVTFLEGLIAHYVLDGGRLVVAHAGLKEAYHGRTSGRVRAFALYGDTTGETDEYGLPVRQPWARDYRGQAMVLYGHTPTLEPEWVNNTLCLDTGAVFGGRLSALRYPSRELVSVPAEREWYAPTKPLAPAVPDREPYALEHDDVAGTRWLESPHAGRVKLEGEQTAAALEVMSRFAVDPRWLIYLPATMSPAPPARVEGLLEHPEPGFDAYRAAGVGEVVCQEKHMGSRAVAVIARDAEVAARRFGISDGSSGTVYTRTGRPFLVDPSQQAKLVDRIRIAVAPLFTELDTDWLCLDGELLPWSIKAAGLIKDHYASVAAAAATSLPAALEVLGRVAARGLDDVDALAARIAHRVDNATAFRAAYRQHVTADPAGSAPGSDDADRLTYAPFQLLAAEGRALAVTESHRWQLEQLSLLSDPMISSTRHCYVDLASAEQRDEATRWWQKLTESGGEGMVIKPLTPPTLRSRIQPGLKVRGREYLRIVYGPDYLDSLDLLRGRNAGRKQHLASREHALGLDALTGFVEHAPLWQIHQRVFAILALESDPVDPRL